MSQGGTVLGHVVVRLRHIDDRVFVEGEGIPIKGPVPAVHLRKPESERQRGPFSPDLREHQQHELSSPSVRGASATYVRRTQGSPPRIDGTEAVGGQLDLLRADSSSSYVKKRT